MLASATVFSDSPERQTHSGVWQTKRPREGHNSDTCGKIKRYQYVDNIGKGAYGVVAKYLDRSSGEHVAIKRMSNLDEDLICLKRAYREVRLLRKLNHPNIVDLVDVIAPNLLVQQQYQQSAAPLSSLFLVFKCEDTDLSMIIRSDQFLSQEHVQFIMYQIVEGVSYLHENNVLHRDLKPANILVNCSDCTIKIADFGLARVVSSTYTECVAAVKDKVANITPDVSPTSARLNKRISTSTSTGTSTTTDAAASNPVMPPKPQPVSRALTRHVVTRWYRAPELILTQPYSAAVDMWSVGCIYAELLGALDSHGLNYRKRRPLFPGKSCGALSPPMDLSPLLSQAQQRLRKRQSYSDAQKTFAVSIQDYQGHQEINSENTFIDYHRDLSGIYSYKSKQSQLSLIFDILGTPDEEDGDLQGLENSAQFFVRDMGRKQSRDLSIIFPGAGDLTLRLLRSMLQFHPGKRITAAESLLHPSFDDIKARGFVAAATGAGTQQPQPQQQSPTTAVTPTSAAPPIAPADPYKIIAGDLIASAQQQAVSANTYQPVRSTTAAVVCSSSSSSSSSTAEQEGTCPCTVDIPSSNNETFPHQRHVEPSPSTTMSALTLNQLPVALGEKENIVRKMHVSLPLFCFDSEQISEMPEHINNSLTQEVRHYLQQCKF